MDREVAERVMGWHLEFREGLGRIAWSSPDNSYEAYPDDWLPSTDIKAAFQVVEKMGEKGWKLGIKPFVVSGYSVFFRRESELVSSTCAKLSELPEAICKAAIAALQV